MMHTETKLGSNFQIKDKTKFNYNRNMEGRYSHIPEYKHDLAYYVKCPNCHNDYIREKVKGLHEPICDHSG